jgi:undecaprenyl-diphosphatase
MKIGEDEMNVQAKYLFRSSIIFTLTFFVLGYLLEFKYVEGLDRKWGQYGYQFGEADAFFIFMSSIGSSKFLYPALFLVSLYLLIKKLHVAIMMVWVNLVGVRLLNTSIKSIYQRERPSLEHIVDASFYSFPSGHAMNAMAFYGMLALLVLFITGNRKIKVLAILISSMIILLIGMSRIYLGVHYPLDVLAGFIAGAAWLTLLIGIWLKIRSRVEQADGTSKEYKENH